jgi:GTPase SAR1 family protein
MAIDIKNLIKVRADNPPRLLFYGPPGIGKTTLAQEFPDAIFLQVEDGTPDGVELNSFGLLETYGDVMDAIRTIYEENLPFRTVVLDSITAMQRLVWAETCARGDEKGNAKANIEDFGYGKGYTYSQRTWQELLDALGMLRRDLGMTIILIAHSKVERFDDPESVSYDRYEIDLHDKSKGAIERDMDAIILLKCPVTIKTEEVGFNKERSRADGGAQVWMHSRGRPAFVAKNRYGIPDKLLYAPGKGFDVLAPYLPESASAPAIVDDVDGKQAA